MAAGFLFLLALAGFVWAPGSPRVQAAPPTAPTVVALPGDFDQQLGCPGDWMPDCPNVRLNYDANDDVWQNVFTITASSPITYNYKAALNNSWTENYGLHAIPNGPNIPLPLTQTTAVKFYYDDKTHWITDNATSVIAVAAGSFQSELGCAGDWDPGCLRSWLQDIDGDGVYTFTTHALPPGTYEAKVALDESWNENYSANCAPGGANIPFEVATNGEGVTFSYDSGTHCLIIASEQVGSLNTAMAHWITRDTIAWQVPCTPQDIYTLHYSPTAGLQLQPQGIAGGQTLSLTCDPTGLGPAILARYPYLSGYAALKLSQQDVGLVPGILKDQVAI
ncbi:MAG TPA: hypothetical protein VFD73_15675, partial [Gemmatimonadales bacterium]|nr:hypothetical protein [Gemmatimonadales bacterium]